jgi:NAD(P)-dependent dehydrogenase (short-subunit alcohol dehydrogenase family)
LQTLARISELHNRNYEIDSSQVLRGKVRIASQSASFVALITGGTTGIGFATARLLHEKGYAVLVTGTNPETLRAAKQSLPSEVAVLRADARSLSDAARIADELKQRFGRVDFAYLNAGVSRMLPLEEVDEAFFDEHFDTNVKGALFTLQKILPLLSNGGSVLFTTSVGALQGIPNYSVALATKGATAAFVPALAAELAPRGIRVNAIRPGPIDTPAFDKLGLPAEAIAGFRQMIPQRVPLGRFGTAEEVADVAAFLASPAARYITGTTIDVDGGMLHAV